MPDSVLGRIVVDIGGGAIAGGGGGPGSSLSQARGADKEVKQQTGFLGSMRTYLGKMTKDSADQPRWWTKALKTMGIQVGLAGILKQSQIFTSTLGAVFQIFGAFVDVLLAPFMPLIIPAIRYLAKGIPAIRKWAQNTFDMFWGWGTKIAGFISSLVTGFGTFKDAIKDIFTQKFWTELGSKIASGVEDAYKTVKNTVFNFFGDKIYNSLIRPTLNWVARNLIAPVVKFVSGKDLSTWEAPLYKLLGNEAMKGGKLGEIPEVPTTGPPPESIEVKSQTDIIAELVPGGETFVEIVSKLGNATGHVVDAFRELGGIPGVIAGGAGAVWVAAKAVEGVFKKLPDAFKATGGGVKFVPGSAGILDLAAFVRGAVEAPVKAVIRTVQAIEDTTAWTMKKFTGGGAGADAGQRAPKGMGVDVPSRIGPGPLEFPSGSPGSLADASRTAPRASKSSMYLGDYGTAGKGNISNAQGKIKALVDWARKAASRAATGVKTGGKNFVNKGWALFDAALKATKGVGMTRTNIVLGKIFGKYIPIIGAVYMGAETVSDLVQIFKGDSPWLKGKFNEETLDKMESTIGKMDEGGSGFFMRGARKTLRGETAAALATQAAVEYGLSMKAVQLAVRGGTGVLGALLATIPTPMTIAAGAALYEGGRFVTGGTANPITGTVYGGREEIEYKELITAIVDASRVVEKNANPTDLKFQIILDSLIPGTTKVSAN